MKKQEIADRAFGMIKKAETELFDNYPDFDVVVGLLRQAADFIEATPVDEEDDTPDDWDDGTRIL